METRNYLALDLGAESGRAILGRLRDGRLETEEVWRFPNEPVSLRGTLTWDFPALLREVRHGIRAAAAATAGRLDGVSVDSWGVDFGLLDRRGRLLSNPVHYRDQRTRGTLELVRERWPEEDLFARTGNRLLEINTLCQLLAVQRDDPELLASAGTLLPIADLIAYFLGAPPAAEVSLASTTQLLDGHTRRWATDLVESFGLPTEILPAIVDSASVAGELLPEILAEAGLEGPVPIVAGASHDTACAVAAVPATEPGSWAFLSSGTWSLLGVELDAPRLDRAAWERGFTNEAGVGGTTRLLALITGLWIVQECRRSWARAGRDLHYDELARLAEEAGPQEARIDPDDGRFATPGDDMPERVREACRESGGTAPESEGEIVRCVLESLAAAYARRTREAGELAGRPIERLHVVGGGSRHTLLNELTARALGMPVVTGPVEATAMGNLLLQALATGAIADRAEIRRVVERSGAPL